MSSIAIINNEYIYKFKLFYRKSIPDLEYFYLLVTFTKYFPTTNITMIFSVISICFSSGLLLVMILTIIIKLTYLNKVVEKVVEIFKKNITQYIR